mgnify:CR=1 FL=1
MKFLYADSIDTVDPGYDFVEERSKPDRKVYWDDQFPHEYLESPPYDGILVSMGVVGDHKFSGKYTQSQAMRFKRVGARKFLRIDTPPFEHLDIYGDCGAFNYSGMSVPPYTPSEILDFYDEGQFTHGCSVDHIIFQFYKNLKGDETPIDISEKNDVKNRFEITLSNAEIFLNESKSLKGKFEPIGVVQGWSPDSMAKAADSLVKMGYEYLALGGMVPLSADSIHIALDAVSKKIKKDTKIHLLGFGKIDRIKEFEKYNIFSIDTTSPLLRAFKDKRRNFFMPGKNNELTYYTAFRIPQSTENRALMRLIKNNLFSYEEVYKKEKNVLNLLRRYGDDDANLEETLQSLMDYSKICLTDHTNLYKDNSVKLENLIEDYKKLLLDKPWEKCDCQVCKKCGIQMAIFRGSNRNKRRGIHNLHVFNNQLKLIL